MSKGRRYRLGFNNGVLEWVGEAPGIVAGAPALDQINFRVRDNSTALNTDGGWLAAENTDPSAISGDTVFRVRFTIDEYNNKVTTYTPVLRAQKNGAGGYLVVPNSSTNNGLRITGGLPTDNAACSTQLLGSESHAFGTNGVYDENASIAAITLTTKGDYLEFEWALLIDTANASDGDYWDLRIYDGTGTLDLYTSEPRVTASIVTGNDYTITGDVTIAVTPAATMVKNTHAAITGAVTIALTAAATMAYAANHEITGDVSIGVTPAATMEYTQAVTFPHVLDFEDSLEVTENADSGNSVTRTTDAALNGSYGMEAAFGGTNPEAYGSYALSEGEADLYVGCRFKLPTGFNFGTAWTYNHIARLMDGSTAIASIQLSEAGGHYTFTARRDAPTYDAGSDIVDPVGIDTEYWIEFRLYSHATAGVIEVWINDTKEQEWTGLNTSAYEADGLYVGLIDISGGGIPESGDSIYVDDITFNTSRTGAPPSNEIVGDVTITVTPAATMEFTKHPEIVGDTTITVTPAATMEQASNYVFTGGWYTILQDSFTVSANTNLDDHVDTEVGGPWSGVSSPFGGFPGDELIIQADIDRVRMETSFTTSSYRIPGDHTDVDVTLTMYTNDPSSGSCAVMVRCPDEAEFTGLWAGWGTGNELYLINIDDTVEDNLYVEGANPSTPLTRVLRLKVEGSRVRLWKDDVEDTDTPVYDDDTEIIPSTGFVALRQAGSTANTPQADYLTVKKFGGGATITVTPAAAMEYASNREITGDTTITVTPAATLEYNLNASIAGDVAITVTPAATMEYTAGGTDYEITGDVTITVTPAATTAFGSGNEITGDVTIAVTPAATLEYNLNASIVGDTTITVTPAATMEFTKHPEFVGDVTITVTPAAAMEYAAGNEIVGDVTITLTPAAAMEYASNREITGDVTITVTPAATMVYEAGGTEYTITGDVTIAVTPAAAMEYAANHLITGDVTITLTPAATMGFSHPAAPTGLVANNTDPSITDTADQVYVGWTDQTGGVYPHAVLYRENGSGDPYSRVNVPAGTEKWVLTGLDPGTEYQITVIAYDGAEESERPATVTATTAGAIITGDVTITVTPAATMEFTKHPEIDGDTTITVTPAAAMEYSSGSEIVGDVTITVTPAATLEYNTHPAIDGDTTITVTPAATMVFEGGGADYEITGDVTITVTPAAAMEYNLNASIVGDVTITITPNATMVTDDEAYTVQLTGVTAAGFTYRVLQITDTEIIDVTHSVPINWIAISA